MQSINLSFTINLSNFILHSVIKHEPHRLHDSYILMTVKDNSFIGGGIFLGEALLKLEDIPLSQIDQNLSELPQIQLPLSKPSCHGMMGRTIFQFDIYESFQQVQHLPLLKFQYSTSNSNFENLQCACGLPQHITVFLLASI